MSEAVALCQHCRKDGSDIVTHCGSAIHPPGASAITSTTGNASTGSSSSSSSTVTDYSSLGCFFHARCYPMPLFSTEEGPKIVSCPGCHRCTSTPAAMAGRSATLTVLPILQTRKSMEEAQKRAAQTALSNKRGKKRVNATIQRLMNHPYLVPEDTTTATNLFEKKQKKLSTTGASSSSSSIANANHPATHSQTASSLLRIGRWTKEETAYCDKLVLLFQQGKLPIPTHTKLNDFLSYLLKSKATRLSKKKLLATASNNNNNNTAISSLAYTPTTGYIDSVSEAQEVSHLEHEFVQSITCPMERAEIQFHIQQVWRQLFIQRWNDNYRHRIRIRIDDWLWSVQEIERRTQSWRDMHRIQNKRLLMGYALDQDMTVPQPGIFIDTDAATASWSSHQRSANCTIIRNEMLMMNDINNNTGLGGPTTMTHDWNSVTTSTVVARMITFVQRLSLPFEYVDMWVPTMEPLINGVPASERTCRLCFGGSAASDSYIHPETNLAEVSNEQDLFDLVSFGDYSRKFSFDVGCGLPGHVYEQGKARWERNVHLQSTAGFGRHGGATQWGLRTALALCVPSLKVGRLVVVFYSKYDRVKDDTIVSTLEAELKRLIPLPRWRLMVDVGSDLADSSLFMTFDEDLSRSDLVSVIEANLPQNGSNKLSTVLSLADELLALLKKKDPSPPEIDFIRDVLTRFSIYQRKSLDPSDIPWHIVNDYSRIKYQKKESESCTSRVAPSLCERTCSRLDYTCGDDCPDADCNGEPIAIGEFRDVIGCSTLPNADKLLSDENELNRQNKTALVDKQRCCGKSSGC